MPTNHEQAMRLPVDRRREYFKMTFITGAARVMSATDTDFNTEGLRKHCDAAMSELYAGRIPTSEVHMAGVQYACDYFGLDHHDALFEFLGVNA